MAEGSEGEVLWAGWRSEYVGRAAKKSESTTGSLFADLFASDLPDEETNIIWRGQTVFVLLNAFPYGTGHLLVTPIRPVSELGDLTPEESSELWAAINMGVTAVKTAYNPDGVNIGFNLGRAAGASIPQHLHGHILPRWSADTAFMATLVNTRVLPESLIVTGRKLRAAWPSSA